MLYLMMDKRENSNLVKVGVTRQITSRRSQYKSHNPFAIMRSSCAETEAKESQCHTDLYMISKNILGTE